MKILLYVLAGFGIIFLIIIVLLIKLIFSGGKGSDGGGVDDDTPPQERKRLENIVKNVFNESGLKDLPPYYISGVTDTSTIQLGPEYVTVTFHGYNSNSITLSLKQQLEQLCKDNPHNWSKDSYVYHYHKTLNDASFESVSFSIKPKSTMLTICHFQQ